LKYNFDVEIAISKKRTWGSTKCLHIHSRDITDCLKIILYNDGEPFGLSDKVVSDLSYFLSTITRNADFCSLVYTNFKTLVKDYKEHK